jgi:hypothetical protein
MSDERKDAYFATLGPKEAAEECGKRFSDYDKHIVSSGRHALWARCYAFFNQGIFKDGRLNRVGDQGEYTEIYLNHFRNILTHMLVMTTSQRPSFDAKSTNTDYDSQAQTIVANGILEYYERFKGMDEIARQAVEDCLVFADGYVYMGWDFSLGNPIAPDLATGKIQKEGDILFKNYTPLDVCFDFKAGLRGATNQWYILRDFQNKWDLIARYPEMRDKIVRYSDDSNYGKLGTISALPNDSDAVPVYIFIHDRTDAVPNGRIVTYMGPDCVFIDSPLPKFYKKLPLYNIRGSKQRGSGFGYTIGYDLAPIQEAYNALNSVIITNQSTFGVQNILVANGSNIGVVELADGLNVINYNPAFPPPQALNLVSTPKEIFDYIAILEGVAERISGINSTQRGNPSENLKSGTALALVQSMAIQFMSGLQQSHAHLLEDLATGMIEILKDRATSPRLIEIAGKNNRSYIKSFSKQDISDISRVTVDLGNPLTRTLAGKVNMAENLLNAKLINDAEQYIQVLTTGRLEPLIENQQSELMLIKAENEALSEGKPVSVTALDSTHLHIAEHRAVLASPEARSKPNVVKAVLDHIQQHIDGWKQTDPALLSMIGEPLPPPIIAAPPPPGPGKPGAKAPGNAAAVNATDPNLAAGANAEPAKLPKNPLTGQPNAPVAAAA